MNTAVGVVGDGEDNVNLVMVYMVMLPRGERGGANEISAEEEESATTVGGSVPKGTKSKQ